VSSEDGTEEYYWNNAEATVHPICFNENISVTVVHENLTFILTSWNVMPL
jgi:hypothetical protein